MDFEIGISAYCRRCGSKDAIFVIKVLITSYHKIDRDTLLSEREGYTSYQTLFSTYLCRGCCEATTSSFENWINDYQVNFLIANVPIEPTNLMIGICLPDRINKKESNKKKQKPGSQIRRKINRKAQRHPVQRASFNNSSMLPLVLQPNSSNNFGSTNRFFRSNKAKLNNRNHDLEKNFDENVNYNNRTNNMINTNNDNQSFNNYLSNIIKEKKKSRSKLSRLIENTNLPFLENSSHFQKRKQVIQNAIASSGDFIMNDLLINRQYFKKLNANDKYKIQESYSEYFKNKKIACEKIQKIIKNFEDQGSLFVNQFIKNDNTKLFFDFLAPKSDMIQIENQNKEFNRFYEKNKKKKIKADLKLTKKKEVEKVNTRPKMKTKMKTKMKEKSGRERKRKGGGGVEGLDGDGDRKGGKGKKRGNNKIRNRNGISNKNKIRNENNISNINKISNLNRSGDKNKISNNGKSNNNKRQFKTGEHPLRVKSKISNDNISHQNHYQNKSNQKYHHGSAKNNGWLEKGRVNKLCNSYLKHTPSKSKSIRKRKFGN